MTDQLDPTPHIPTGIVARVLAAAFAVLATVDMITALVTISPRHAAIAALTAAVALRFHSDAAEIRTKSADVTWQQQREH